MVSMLVDYENGHNVLAKKFSLRIECDKSCQGKALCGKTQGRTCSLCDCRVSCPQHLGMDRIDWPVGIDHDDVRCQPPGFEQETLPHTLQVIESLGLHAIGSALNASGGPLGRHVEQENQPRH